MGPWRAVKQKAPGVASVVEGKQEARARADGEGWQDGLAKGREGRGPWPLPEDAPHGGAHLRGTCECCCGPIGCKWAVGPEVWGPRRPRLGVHCGGRGPQGGAGRAGDGALGEDLTGAEKVLEAESRRCHPGVAVSLANAMMPPGAQAGRHHGGRLCGPGDGQEQLGVVPWGAETRGVWSFPGGWPKAGRGSGKDVSLGEPHGEMASGVRG